MCLLLYLLASWAPQVAWFVALAVWIALVFLFFSLGERVLRSARVTADQLVRRTLAVSAAAWLPCSLAALPGCAAVLGEEKDLLFFLGPWFLLFSIGTPLTGLPGSCFPFLLRSGIW